MACCDRDERQLLVFDRRERVSAALEAAVSRLKLELQSRRGALSPRAGSLALDLAVACAAMAPMRSIFSARSAQDRTQNRITMALAALRADGRAICDLTESNPTTADLPGAHERSLESLADRAALRYEPNALGLPSARSAVAAHVAERGVAVDPEHIVLTASTSEAFAFLFELLCDPGDAVLVPQPSYPLLDALARGACVDLSRYQLRYDGRWHVDLEGVKRAMTPATRALLVVHPNNPTGSFLSRAELAELGALGLPIIGDEVFADYSLRDDAARAASVLEHNSGLVFSLGGLSKSIGLPQLKLAWMCVGGPKDVRDEALARLELIGDTYLSTNGPTQHALPALLDAGRTTRRTITGRTKTNLATLRATLVDTAASVLDVEGGWSAIVRLPAIQSEEEWVLELLQQDHLLVQPGYFYDFTTEPYVVVSLLSRERVFAEGVRRLVARVSTRVANAPVG